MIDRLRNVPARQWITALEHEGFGLRKGKGSHHIYQHPDSRRVLIVYHSLGDTFRPKTIKALLRDTRWTEDDLKRLKLIQ
jgi:predicted RNA binding protein YcfA (HicA-like mRNA interferase family)